MSNRASARQVIEAYSRLFHLFYRRRDPRGYRPRPETLGIMEHLMSTGPLTVAEAALHFGLSQSATSEHIARLVERGLLVTIADERDRRRHLVWLTPEGQALLAEERQVLSVDLVARALRTMTQQQQQALPASLTALADAGANARARRSAGGKDDQNE